MDVGHHRRATKRLAVLSAAVLLGLGGCTSAPAAPAAAAAPADRPSTTPRTSTAPNPAEACPHAEGEDAKLFEFDAFGPPAMAYELIGQAWWQWDGEGHAFEYEGGTVWVVVHDADVDPAELALRFPVRQAERCDHRYVSVHRALDYLDAHIDELSGAEGFEALCTRLRETRTTIAEHFAPAP